MIEPDAVAHDGSGGWVGRGGQTPVRVFGVEGDRVRVDRRTVYVGEGDAEPDGIVGDVGVGHGHLSTHVRGSCDKG